MAPNYAEAERIAVAVVRRWAARLALPPSVSVADLEQYARMGAMVAVQRFDSGRGVRFSTYVAAVSLGTARRGLRDDGRGHLSRRRWAALAAGPRDRCPECGATVRDAEAARCQGCGERYPWACLPEDGPPLSLAEPMGDGGLLEDTVPEAGDGFTSAALARVLADAALRVLEPEERRVVRWHYWENLSQSEIGRRLGWSQMRVARTLSRALGRMRKSLV